MQTEFDLHYPSLQVEIIGMNERGHEIGNASVTDGRDIPWLQDVDGDGDGQSDVWLNSWDFVYRDVVLVDNDGGYQSAFNLTQYDLADPANYQALKDRFTDIAATEPLSRWQSPIEPLDVDGNSVIGPLDALLVINELGNFPPNGALPSTGEVHQYIDTDGDGVVAPLDALLVINQLDVIAAALADAAAPMAPLSSSAVLPIDSEAVETVVRSVDGAETQIADSAPDSTRITPTTFQPLNIPVFDVTDDRWMVGSERSLVVDDASEADRIDDLFADLSWAPF